MPGLGPYSDKNRAPYFELRGVDIFDLLGLDPSSAFTTSSLLHTAKKVADTLHPDRLESYDDIEFPYAVTQAHAIINFLQGSRLLQGEPADGIGVDEAARLELIVKYNPESEWISTWNPAATSADGFLLPISSFITRPLRGHGSIMASTRSGTPASEQIKPEEMDLDSDFEDGMPPKKRAKREESTSTDAAGTSPGLPDSTVPRVSRPYAVVPTDTAMYLGQRRTSNDPTSASAAAASSAATSNLGLGSKAGKQLRWTAIPAGKTNTAVENLIAIATRGMACAVVRSAREQSGAHPQHVVVASYSPAGGLSLLMQGYNLDGVGLFNWTGDDNATISFANIRERGYFVGVFGTVTNPTEYSLIQILQAYGRAR